MQSHKLDYTAKREYIHDTVATGYLQREHYSSKLGKYRLLCETRAINKALQYLTSNSTIIDCPCGTGRWFSALEKKANKIIGIDISPNMINYVQEQYTASEYVFLLSEGERLPFQSNSVDHLFSFALLKHIPFFFQYQFFKEFKRITRKRFIVSMSIIDLISFPTWVLNRQYYPNSIWKYELHNMLDHLDLKLVDIFKASTPMGLESMLIIE